MTYLIDGHGNNPFAPNKKVIDYRVYRCFYNKCIVPTPPPVPTGSPSNGTRHWSRVGEYYFSNFYLIF